MLSAVPFTGSYSQDFDTLPDVGTSFFYGGLTDLDARPIDAAGMVGWQTHKPAGQSEFVTFIADSGNSASSSLRSFGGLDLPDRALGSITNELGSYAYGVTLTNDTGGALTSLTLTFAGEQWQESGALAAQALRFEYALGEGVSLNQGTFVAAPALDFTAPHHGGTIRTLDGNDAANRTIVTATISGIVWTPGEELVLRWSDDDDADADHGLGIDDLTLTASPLNLTAPVFAAGTAQTLTIAENSTTGVIVGLAAAADPDAPVEPLSYSITAGGPTGPFAIDANGQLTIADAALLDLDYENGEQVATLTVQVSDGLHTAEQVVTVNVSPLNDESPAFAAGGLQTLWIDENSPSGTVVGQATATDADLPAETLTYSLIDGDPTGAFAIDANGQLSIADAALLDLDYENGEQVALLTVQVSDGVNTAMQSIAVNVLPLNDNAPQFTTTASLAVDENSVDVVTLAATDADLPSQTLAFSIIGGADAALFTIVSGNELKLLAGLDYESPTDADADGVYVVEVQVDDGAGEVATLVLAIAVTDLDETPPLMAFGQLPSSEEIEALDEVFGEAEAFASAVAAALLA